MQHINQQNGIGASSPIEKGRIAYILAASHSGSTLLAMLLGSHPQALTVGELKATSLGDPNTYRCSCGQTIRDCGFWTRVSAEMKKRNHDFNIANAHMSIQSTPSPYLNRLLRPLCRGTVGELVRDVSLSISPTWRKHLRINADRNAALIQCLTRITGAKIVVDSSKLALRLKYLLRNPNLDVRVIRLLRDGRAVSLTYTDEWTFADASDPSLRGGGTGKPRNKASKNMTQAAHEWRRSNESADCVMSMVKPDSLLKVRYEDVCQDPLNKLNEIYRFLGLTEIDKVPDFKNLEHHVVGNGMRMDKTSAIKLDDRWKTHLSAAQIAEFDQEAGALNKSYGYL